MANESSQTPKSKFKEMVDTFPIIQFVGAGLIGLVATWTTVQLTQNSQAAEIRRNKEEIEQLKKEQTPFILFDERTRTIIESQKQLNEKFDKLLEKK